MNHADDTTEPLHAPAATAGGGWRIDDLAHRAGVTVDTIRYYQREGLLSPGRRSGRTNLYFGEHLERLERIKELQHRRFSLAAIRALLDDERHGLLDSVFAERDERLFTFDELVERGGVDPRFVTALQEAGILRPPAEHGQDAYDGDDLDLLCSMAELRRVGVPPEMVITLGRTYADGIEATQQAVTTLFTTGGDLGWSPAQLRDFQQVIDRSSREMLPIARRIVGYTFRRTIQRIILDAIEQGALPPLTSADPTTGDPGSDDS
jgi:DNA-binding transcriptional MerR regulator